MRVNGITLRACLALTVLALAGCSGGGTRASAPPDPAVIADEELTITKRRAAIEGARIELARGLEDAELRETLKEVAWSRRARQDLRREA
ncbi:MAG: hypothetical protein AAGH64_03675, partial [Planctomycetota bacterium]